MASTSRLVPSTLIVPGEVTHRQQGHTGLLLGLPVTLTQALAGGDEFGLAGLAAPVGFEGKFQLALGADTGKAQGCAQVIGSIPYAHSSDGELDDLAIQMFTHQNDKIRWRWLLNPFQLALKKFSRRATSRRPGTTRRDTMAVSSNPGIDIKHLKTVSALAEQGSLAGAALTLNLTQSALSHQLKELETRLNLELYLRKSRPLVLTAAGNQLLGLARQVLPALAQTEKQLQALHSGEAGRLHLALDCHSCIQWLLPLLPDFRRQWPGWIWK